ncbi:MAG: transglutaminase domain-containing protein [Verrucomicrobia bacterium]|nr:MAG: transglutaminase domain-containing protein [Verrucomicrobiota bacterium]
MDLVDVGGDIYDVDFFMSGPPGNMTVTETTVHKFNGQPFYTWEQDEDRSWHRVAMENATPGHLGVINGSDEFEFVYRTTVPELTESARMWLPVPETDQFQTVKLVSMKVPGQHRFLTDRDHGNQILFVELEPRDSGQTVEIRYHVRRHEKACYAESEADLGKFLQPARLVPDNDEFRAEAEQVVAGKKSDLVRARALYDHVIDKMRYIKIGDSYGHGDAVYACDSGTGNCTDFHSYFIALARSVDIPARFAIGAAIPSSRDEGRINGYHCWAEFYADDKWWPVDISEGDKYSSLATYYFGHHPANRVEFSRGRDLVVEPGPAVGSINFLAYPVLEVGGETVKIAVEFSFTRPGPAGGSEG